MLETRVIEKIELVGNSEFATNFQNTDKMEKKEVGSYHHRFRTLKALQTFPEP